MSTTGNTAFPTVDMSKLPKVYQAALFLLQQMGMNPDRIYSLKVSDIAGDLILGSPPHSPEGTTVPASNTDDQSRAFWDYVNHHRPTIVQRIEAKGGVVPDRLLLRENGMAITLEGLQKALLRAIPQGRCPKIDSFQGLARCKPTEMNSEASGRLYPVATSSLAPMCRFYLPNTRDRARIPK